MSVKKTSASSSRATGATPAATEQFATRWRGSFQPDFYRATRTGLTVSSVALGTYLGESDDETDTLYVEAIGGALSSGVNVIDSAINYRCQRSERNAGTALRDCIAAGAITRDA